MNDNTHSGGELIPLTQTGGGVQAVMGRDLHTFLGIGRDYTNWMKQMIGYGFTEGQDFQIIKETAGHPGSPNLANTRHNHIVSLDMAKEISMIQRTERGKQARRYFIECERRAQLGEMSELDEAKLVQRALQITYRQVQQLAAENADMAPKANYYDTFVADEDLIQFRTLANQLQVTEKQLRQMLIDHKWIYRLTGKRWSNKRNDIVTVYQYRAYAEKKHLFRLIPCHEAPRINGEVQQALKLTPQGAETVTRYMQKWQAQMVLDIGTGGEAA